MEQSQERRGGSRRHFIQTSTAALGTAAIAAQSTSAGFHLEPGSKLPEIILGKTGQKVTRLGMGTSWTLQPGFVQAMIAAGVRYIDTAEGYERGKCETVLGQVLERVGKRKELYLVTKNSSYRGSGDPGVFERQLNKSLERLKTDYVDSYYLHGLKGTQIGMLKDPAVRQAFEALKKAGKIRFCGLSCHDSRLVEVVEAAAECGWLDQIMIQYNYRTMGSDAIKRAVDKASKANLGLVAMKTQGGAGEFKEGKDAASFKTFTEKGFKKEQAAIKAVFADERIQVVVSEMTNRQMLRENMAATIDPPTPKEARILEEHRRKTAHLYCQGCGHFCETAARGVPIADILRYLRYDEVYGKRAEARALYRNLPEEARSPAVADLAAAQAACPHGLPVVDLVARADRDLA